MNLPKLQTCFPKWRLLSNLEPSLWTISYDYGEQNFFELLLRIIENDQADALQVSRESLYRLAAAMVEDLLLLQKTASPDDRISLQYIQFEASVRPLHVAIGYGEAGIAYDWILNAVGESVSTEVVREFDLERIHVFMHTETNWIVDNRLHCFQQWLPNFYYYCRNWAALYEVAAGLMPHTLRIIHGHGPHTDPALRSIVFALNWATANRHWSEPILVKLAMATFNNPAIPESLKALIAAGFCTSDAARFTPKKSDEWAKWALEKVSADLVPCEELQALIATIATVPDWDARRHAVLEAIDNYINSLRFPSMQPAAFVQTIEQSIKILDPLIYKLHAFGLSNALLEVLCHWYAVPEGTRRHESVLFCMANHSAGMAYLGLRDHVIPFADAKAIDTLADETSRALGIVLSLQGQREPYPVATRHGTPEYALAPAFEQVLLNHYRWTELVHSECISARASVFLPGLPASTSSSHASRNWPMSTDFLKFARATSGPSHSTCCHLVFRRRQLF